MAEQVTAISRAISDILTGAYSSKRLTQEVVAERAEMSIWTLQKKLRGRSPITATDLVVLSQAIGVSPSKVLEDALEALAGAPVTSPVSAPIANLTDQREKKTPAEMTEVEMMGERNAANHDPEIGHDEPDPA